MDAGRSDAEDVGPLGRIEADLELQAAGHARRERDAEVAERTRAERGALTLADRWRAAAEEPGRPGGRREVEVEVGGLGRLRGVVVDVGADHVALSTTTGRAWVALDAVVGVTGLPAHAAAPPATVAARWSWRGVLRELAAAAVPVRVHRRDGEVLAGRAVLVAADHLDVLVGDVGPGARDAAVRRVSVPLAVVAAVEAGV